MMDSLMRNLRVLWRAETIIADIRFRQIATRSGLRGAAAFLGIFAYLMANLAVFFALLPAWGSIGAAALIALGNIVLAILLLVLAERSRPGREMELALEVRNAALQGLETDAQAVQAQLAELRDEVRGMRQAVVGFVRHPVDSVLPGLIVPLAGAIIKGLKKSDGEKT
ncbi:phage holin family protein [Microvirga terricola]|uniref:Phage holin family protein n=1 Tax=Microvirga terricola TaxID=2719797 RepID=A0ABX0VAK6_9HYPH|nr:phage holin family protein [Microvirga terricola]NIX76376.1 phage holin family protein [Microvirga terricola]